MPAFILMGVSGSGKSTIGRCVAESLGLPFIEGDDYHPAVNIEKMANGIPLDAADRIAWIDALMTATNGVVASNVIVACSALTSAVREKINALSTRPTVFLHLQADPATIANRLRTRGAHFMQADMLPSQLLALQPGNDMIAIDGTLPAVDVCAAVQETIAERLSP